MNENFSWINFAITKSAFLTTICLAIFGSIILESTGTYDTPDPPLDYIIKPGQANTLRYQVGRLQTHAIKVKTSTYLRSSIGCNKLR